MLTAVIWISWLVFIVLFVAILYKIYQGGPPDMNVLFGFFAAITSLLIAIYAPRLQLAPIDPEGVAQRREIPTVSLPEPTATLVSTSTSTPIIEEPIPTEKPIDTSTPTIVPIATETLTNPPTEILEPTNTSTETAVPAARPTLPPTSTTTPTATELPATSTATATPTPTPTPTPIPAAGEARVIVEGIGFAPENETNAAKREISALLAAEIVAKRELVEWAEGAIIESITVIESGTLTADVIRQIIRAKVPPYKVIEKRYDAETGTGYVTLELVIEPEP